MNNANVYCDMRDAFNQLLAITLVKLLKNMAM